MVDAAFQNKLDTILGYVSDPIWKEKIDSYLKETQDSFIINHLAQYGVIIDTITQRPMIKTIWRNEVVWNGVEDDEPQQIGKWILGKREQYAGRRYVHIDAQAGIIPIGVSEAMPIALVTEANLYIMVRCILSMVWNKIWFPLKLTVTPDELSTYEYDVLGVSNVFYRKEMAIRNMELAKRAFQDSKEVIICSNSLWEQSNPFVKLEKEQMEFLGAWTFKVSPAAVPYFSKTEVTRTVFRLKNR